MKPSSARGKINATRMRSQLIASVPRGVTTGAPAGLTCAFGTGVAADTAGVEVVVAAGFTVLLAGGGPKANPLEKVKTNSTSTPITPSVVGKCSRLSESAAGTRANCTNTNSGIPHPSAL